MIIVRNEQDIRELLHQCNDAEEFGTNNKKMSKRVAYFGTQGGGIPGHSFTAIVGEFSYEEEREVIRLDCDTTFKVFDGKRQFKFFNYGKYMCLAFPASPDDKRGGSITIVLIEGKDTSRKEILETIGTSSFLKKQFNRLCELYGVQMPQV